MAINTDLFINLITQFKSKGIKDAEKGFKGLLRNTNGLNRSLGILARRVAVFETLRRSFNAFVEDDAAARRLNTTLNNLGLSFSALAAEDYISNLERTSRVLDDQLRPAFESIARVTGNFQETQSILNTALDVAAGTGQDVVSISKALSRAYAGNTTSLSRLNAGLTKAELATGNFVVIQEKLNTLFAGQNAALVDTYQGKINGLRVAFANAGEAVGKGLVDGITALSGGDVQNAINFIVAAGEKIGAAFRFAGKQIAFVKEIFTRKDFFSAESQLELFEKFSKTQDPARLRATYRERSKALKEEAKVADKIARTRAKSAAAEKARLAAAKKAEQDKTALTNAEKIFDDQRISLEAALQNEKLSENELTRLQLKKAILNENADRATMLADKLKKSQEELARLQDFQLTNNPFDNWIKALEQFRVGLSQVSVPLSSVYSNQTLDNISKNPPNIFTDPGFNFSVPEFDYGSVGTPFANMPTQGAQINITVQGTGGLDAETKQAVVDAVVEASSSGYSTQWFRTTSRAVI